MKQLSFKIFVTVALIVILAVTMTHNAAAAAPTNGTFTVNSIGDDPDASPGNGLCRTGFGECTLRAAIQEANANIGYYTIAFDIYNCPCVLQPKSFYPTIYSHVTIDGYTQPGSAPNTAKRGSNAKIMVTLDGSMAGADANALRLGYGSDGSTIRGLSMKSFPGSDVEIYSNGNFILGNFIASSQKHGIVVTRDTSDNTIGDGSLAGRNLIQSNTFDGVFVLDNTNGTKIWGNAIGIGANGKDHVGNSNGITSLGTNVQVFQNQIAYNKQNGVAISTAASNLISQNAIYGNDVQGIALYAGANHSQTAPKLQKATSATKTVKGKLVSTPNATFFVQLFKNKGCDTGGYGEGKTYLGGDYVKTDSGGVGTFSIKVKKKFKVGQVITATAINTNTYDTSAFSKCKVAK